MTWHRLGRDADHPAGIARYLERGDDLYIFVDGTRNNREWRLNFQTLRFRPWGDKARVSVKDFEQARAVRHALDDAGVTFVGRRVVIGGYSRGYAIALILAYDMLDTPYVPTVWGWAGKRAGNRAFMRALETWEVCTSNLSHRGDIVPYLPPWYAPTPTVWHSPRMLPHAAHIHAGHQAARWRHEVTLQIAEQANGGEA